MHCNDQLDDRDLAPILDDSFEDKTGLAPPPILMFADVFDGTISDPNVLLLDEASRRLHLFFAW